MLLFQTNQRFYKRFTSYKSPILSVNLYYLMMANFSLNHTNFFKFLILSFYGLTKHDTFPYYVIISKITYEYSRLSYFYYLVTMAIFLAAGIIAYFLFNQKFPFIF